MNIKYTLIVFLISVISSTFSQKILVKKTRYNETTGVLTDLKNIPINGIVYDIYSKRKVSWEKQYQDGKLNGYSQKWNYSGDLISKCHYLDGKKEGSQKYWRENGSLFYEENYKDDLFDGVRKYYFNNGNLFYEENFLKGKLNGSCKIYYSTGQLMLECFFINGNADGSFKTWFENGKLKTECFFVNGLLHGIRKAWFENGILAFENNYKNGVLSGAKRGWFDNGSLKFENTLENDKLTGIQRYYDYNGNILCETNLINGNGKIFIKDNFGKVVFERIYKDSILFSEKRWDDSGKIMYNVMEDTLKVWYQNGQLCQLLSYKDKELISKICWMYNGQEYDPTVANSSECQSDLDKDGVCDCNDHCPELAGEFDNNGCPMNDIEDIFGKTYFPGGELELQKFLVENVEFPESCMEMDAQGRVFVKFTVEKDGRFSNLVIESNKTGCDHFSNEARRVLSLMPLWIPGEEGGVLKRTICRLPFNFKIY